MFYAPFSGALRKQRQVGTNFRWKRSPQRSSRWRIRRRRTAIRRPCKPRGNFDHWQGSGLPWSPLHSFWRSRSRFPRLRDSRSVKIQEVATMPPRSFAHYIDIYTRILFPALNRIYLLFPMHIRSAENIQEQSVIRDEY